MNTYKIFSLIPLTSLSTRVVNEISKYPIREHHYKNRVYDSTFWDEIDMDIKLFNKKTRRRIIGNPTIVILCDTEYESCTNNEEHTYVESDYWEDYNAYGELKSSRDWKVNVYPFGDVGGCLRRVISRFKNTDQRLQAAQMRIIEISVYFSDREGLSNVYDEDKGDSHYIARHKATGKLFTYVSLLKQKIARENEDCMVYVDSDGKRKLRKLTVDSAISDFKRFLEYEEFSREQQQNSLWQSYDDEYNSEGDEKGCGNGWSCDSCPNYGCPANERN